MAPNRHSSISCQACSVTYTCARYSQGIRRWLVRLPALTEAKSVYADYVATRLTLRTQPVAVMAERIAARTPTDQLRDYPDGAPVTVCGLVVCRQRPGTASGVVFLTLEDERGTFDLII